VTTAGKKITRDTVRRRVLFVEQLLAQGHSHTEVCRRLRAEHNVSTRTGERYIARVRATLGETAEPSQDKREQLEKQLAAVFSDAWTEGKYSAAVQAQRLRAEIHGLLKVRTEVTGPDGGPVRHEHSGAVIFVPQRDDDAG